MKSYVFNPEYVVSENDHANIVFSSNMEYAYVFKEVESIILKTFFQAKRMDEAVSEIQPLFSNDSFKLKECVEFISLLITEGVLIDAEN